MKEDSLKPACSIATIYVGANKNVSQQEKILLGVFVNKNFNSIDKDEMKEWIDLCTDGGWDNTVQMFGTCAEMITDNRDGECISEIADFFQKVDSISKENIENRKQLMNVIEQKWVNDVQKLVSESQLAHKSEESRTTSVGVDLGEPKKTNSNSFASLFKDLVLILLGAIFGGSERSKKSSDIRGSTKKNETRVGIGNAVQRGSWVHIYDENGQHTGSVSVGNGPEDGLKGYTSSTVNVRRGAWIQNFDYKGHPKGSSTPAK